MLDKFNSIYENTYKNFDELLEIYYGYKNFISTKNFIYKSDYIMYLSLKEDSFYKKFIEGVCVVEKKLEDLNKYRNPTLELMITDSCNLKCLHCHKQTIKRKNYFLKLSEIKNVVDKCYSLNEILHNKSTFGNIRMTGGEPTLHKDLKNIIKLLHNVPHTGNITLMTNGIHIPETLLKYLKQFNVIVQISIDGFKPSHEYIRGKNTFDKTISNVNKLIKYGIKVVINFTANSYNYRDYTKLVNLFENSGIYYMWSDRYVDQKNKYLLPLDKQNTIEYYNNLHKLSNKKHIKLYRNFQSNNSHTCSAGYNFKIWIDGTIIPCGKINIKIANINEPINDIIKKITLFKLKFLFPPIDCLRCYKVISCCGGEKCISFSENNFTSNIKDTACPL